MPVVNGRLTCCVCGADLGDAEDPYRDPDCEACDRRETQAELDREADEDAPIWDEEHPNTHVSWCPCPDCCAVR